jgi:glutamate-1-semialdehyde 2,1-aminomutase
LFEKTDQRQADRVSCYAGTTACDVERFKRFFYGMLDEGVYLASSAFKSGFVSAAYTEGDIDATVAAAAQAFAQI